MAERLTEVRRLLKPTGSLHLHCDPTVSHYLKGLLNAIFGAEHFRNEVTWRRSNPKSLSKVNFRDPRTSLPPTTSLQWCRPPVISSLSGDQG